MLIFLAFLFILYSISFVLIWFPFCFSLFDFLFRFSFSHFYSHLFLCFSYCFHYFNFAFADGHNSFGGRRRMETENIMPCYFQYTLIYSHTYLYVYIRLCMCTIYIYNTIIAIKQQSKKWQSFVSGSTEKVE